MRIDVWDYDYLDEIGRQIFWRLREKLTSDYLFQDILNLKDEEIKDFNEDIETLNKLFDLNIPSNKRDSILWLAELVSQNSIHMNTLTSEFKPAALSTNLVQKQKDTIKDIVNLKSLLIENSTYISEEKKEECIYELERIISDLVLIKEDSIYEIEISKIQKLLYLNN